MIVEQRFIAFDGKEFKTEEECVDYENFKTVIPNIITSLKKLQEICNKQADCDSCVFHNNFSECCLLNESLPGYWDLESVGD